MARKRTKGRTSIVQHIPEKEQAYDSQGRPLVDLKGKPVMRPTGKFRTIYHSPNPKR